MKDSEKYLIGKVRAIQIRDHQCPEMHDRIRTYSFIDEEAQFGIPEDWRKDPCNLDFLDEGKSLFGYVLELI